MCVSNLKKMWQIKTHLLYKRETCSCFVNSLAKLPSCVIFISFIYFFCRRNLLKLWNGVTAESARAEKLFPNTSRTRVTLAGVAVAAADGSNVFMRSVPALQTAAATVVCGCGGLLSARDSSSVESTAAAFQCPYSVIYFFIFLSHLSIWRSPPFLSAFSQPRAPAQPIVH